MTTTELVQRLAKRLSITQKEARWLLDLQIQGIRDHLVAGRKVVLRNFGTFGVRETPAHRGVSPKDGSPIQIPAKRHATFHPAKALKQGLEEAEAHE